MADLATTSNSSFVNRMIRAARLEVPLYEEVEADITATQQALLVVVIASVANGIGSALTTRTNPVAGLVFGVLSSLLAWAVWSFVVYFVGTRMFGGTATYGELLRTLGFAQTPQILLILGFIPVLGGILRLIVLIWAIVAGFIATRQALDIDNTKTFFTIVIGIIAIFIVVAIVSTILGAIFGLGVLVGSLM
jgi:hypothetical protein